MPPHDRSVVDAASRAPWLTDVRRSYIDQAALGYTMYLLGAVTAFLAAALALSDAEAGLHSSAMAVGMVGASLVGHRLDDRFGIRAVHAAALGLLGLSAVLIAWAPAFAVTLAGAACQGIGSGLILGHVNASVSAAGGVRALMQFTRSTLVAMTLSVTVPLVIGLGIALSAGWEFAALPALVLVGLALAATRGRPTRASAEPPAHGRLPRAFWVPWLVTVLVVAVEFAILYWASAMVERSTGVSLADATLTISVYIAGIILVRGAVSTPMFGSRDPVWLLRVTLLLCLAGTLLVWLSSSYALSVAAMFVAGLGLGALYPVSASVTLAMAPDQPALAAVRVVLASGTAIFSAPFIFGVVADLTGVSVAWLLIPGLCVASLLLTVPVARLRRSAVTALTSPAAATAS